MTGAGTDWSVFRLEQIWEMVSGEDGRVNWAQHDAWGRMALLCSDQADQLEKALNQLLARWPPRPGSAAEAFKNRVELLVTSMRENARAALANQEPLRKISYAIGFARAEIAALVEQRRRYAAAEQQLFPRPTPSPGQIPVPAAPTDVEPPPLNWRAKIDQQARAIMQQVDADVGREYPSIKVPQSYASNFSRAEVREPVGMPALLGPGQIERSGPLTFDPPTPLLLRRGSPLPVLDGFVAPPFDENPVRAEPRPIAMIAPPTGGVSESLVLTPSMRSGVRGNEGMTRQRGAQTPGRTTVSQSIPITPMLPPPLGARPATVATRSAIPHNGMTVAIRRGRRQEAADDPRWSIRQTVPAVLEPAPTPDEHDPGPGVIGLKQ